MVAYLGEGLISKSEFLGGGIFEGGIFGGGGVFENLRSLKLNRFSFFKLMF